MPADGKSTSIPPNAPKRPGISPVFRWLFRLMALSLPLILLGISEGITRWLGIGHSTDFFVRQSVSGRTVWSENADFGLRFFPKELARVPSPLVMEEPKSSGTYRIFLFGESAALGDPEPALGMGRYLRVLLEDRYPGVRFEVIPVAMTAINSHALLPMARECVHREGDLWIVYMGNNEMVGPFGAGTVLGPQVPSLLWVRASLALQRLHLVQGLTEWLKRKTGGAQATSWGGMKMFLDAQVPPWDPRKQAVYSAFQQNLTDMLRAAKGIGVPVVLCTVASNLKDCAPFASKNWPTTTSEEAANRADEAAGRADYGASRWLGALKHFQAAAMPNDQSAALAFEIGRCQLALSNSAAALEAFARARDLDSLPFRADSTINETIRTQARIHSVTFIDTVEVVQKASPDGIPGNNLFHDHVHFNFDGNYLLARTIAEKARELLPPGVKAHEKGDDWDSHQQASDRLALTDWDLRRVYDNMGRRLSEPPFTTQLTHTNEIERIRSELRRIRDHRSKTGAAEARSLYTNALVRNPEDFQIAGNLAKFYEDTERWGEARSTWLQVQQLIPWEPAPYFYLGKAAARDRHPDDALTYLDQALKLRPDLADAYLEQGRIWLEKRDFASAQSAGERALMYQPTNARILLALAEVHLASGDTNAALGRLKSAATAQPSLWEARYLLGLQWVGRGELESAREEFAAVTRLRPDNVQAHFNLGVALARLDKRSEAKAEFETTIKLDPKNTRAREYIKNLDAGK